MPGYGIDLIIALALGYLVYQDWQYRAISWVLYPFLLVFIIIRATMLVSWPQLGTYVLVNAMLLSFQLISITLFLWLRHKKRVNPLAGYFGLGDLLFWVLLAVGFSPVNFMCFHVGSLVLALLLHKLLARYKAYGGSNKIPLAGFQALFYIFVLFMPYILPAFGRYDDTALLLLLQSLL